MVCVYEAMSFIYSHKVIEGYANKKLLAEYDWEWLKTAVQANKLQVTSNGRWLSNQQASGQGNALTYDCAGTTPLHLDGVAEPVQTCVLLARQ